MRLHAHPDGEAPVHRPHCATFTSLLAIHITNDGQNDGHAGPHWAQEALAGCAGALATVPAVLTLVDTAIRAGPTSALVFKCTAT